MSKKILGIQPSNVLIVETTCEHPSRLNALVISTNSHSEFYAL